MTVDRSEDNALHLDSAVDPALRRDDFLIPPAPGGAFPLASYMVGNSLGLQPRATRAEVMANLDAWEERAVQGHFEGTSPWLSQTAALCAPSARLVGALPQEIVVMNSLTVNLHLLLSTFYRPTATRHRILIEDHAFPSDIYAVRSHVALRGYDPDTAILFLRPRPGEDTLRAEDIVETLSDHSHSIATVLIGGVNYLTGEVIDMQSVTLAGRDIGATVGWDLAHAVGNVPLSLHEWDVDFAAWCTYKYLNSGPGAAAGVFVNERHLNDPTLQRLEGWWSTRADVRFEMLPYSTPPQSAEAWAISNPPILSMAPVRTALEIFDSVGFGPIRERSLRLTAYLRGLLESLANNVEVITPAEDARHGAQLSIRVATDIEVLTKRLAENHGVIADDRKPDIVRLAPAPLYCTFHDCWRAADALSEELTGSGLV